MLKQIKAAVIGFGDRSEIYSRFSLKEPDLLKITAVVEPDAVRREYARKLFGLDRSMCFADEKDFIARGKIADCVINGTMDELHISTTLPLLPLGYDVLLEKPVTSDEKAFLHLLQEAERYGCRIVVCHVLRYTPFYKAVKKLVDEGAVGKVRHIETAENVGIAHASISYIRGKWNNSVICGSSYLLAKCCHDLDLICWLNDKTEPVTVSSMGGRDFFIPENAPKGAGTRCLADCPVEKSCPYSARKIYLDNDPMPITVWNGAEKPYWEIDKKEREKALETTHPHGRCIFKTDANLVDQQMTNIKFADGSTAYHLLFSGATRAGRRIKIYGSLGEIEGFSEDGSFKVRKYNPENLLYDETEIKITDDIANDNHMGGDSRLMYDFVRVLGGEEPSVSTSDLKKSFISHLCVYAADRSLEENRTIELKRI